MFSLDKFPFGSHLSFLWQHSGNTRVHGEAFRDCLVNVVNRFLLRLINAGYLFSAELPPGGCPGGPLLGFWDKLCFQ